MERATYESDVERAADLLGGEEVLQVSIRNVLDVHEVLLKGLPTDALLHLVSAVSFLERGNALNQAIGMSVRTLQRHKAKSARKLLSVEQSNRAWRFAEIFSHAADVMGSEQAAEEWMNTPAIGLSNRKPVELLATSAGSEAVDDHLTRLEYGVYA